MENGYPASWYLDTARALRTRPMLRAAERADVCVIGGGYTGLSAALHLAERGYDVVLLEANRVAWGASGRNGGQVGSGQRQDEATLEADHGRETALRLWTLAEEAKALVRGRIERHAIECDLRAGQLVVAAKAAHAEMLRRRAEKLAADYGYAQARFVDARELPEMLGSRVFHGGLLDAGAMHLHPLNYALGLARACDGAGVRIYEHSAALDYTRSAPSRVRTLHGEVTAGHVVLGCDGYLGRLEPRIAARNMPIGNYMIATAPLDVAQARALIRDDVCVHDTRFVVNYFRLSADRRLLFGGGETYRRAFPADVAGLVRPYLLRIFPQLAAVPVTHAWGGVLGVTRTRLPHVGRLEPNVYFAHGFSGHGISIGTLAGALIAEALAGTAERFDVLARLPAPAWPGGTLLRAPLTALGMLWYALRDRL
jgi:gamma-glutamylputrescine oxidase